MSKLMSIFRNPYLLGTQGFLAGALLLWANPQVLQGAQTSAPAAAVQLVPSVS